VTLGKTGIRRKPALGKLRFGKDSLNILINVKGEAVESKDNIKALGIRIDKGLNWAPHVSSLKKRIMIVIGGVRMIRNKLTAKQGTSIVAAQIFSILYYACAVWLTPSLNRKVLGTVESLHYKALRLIIRDYRQKVSRDLVTQRTKRLPPDKSLNFYTQRREPGFDFAYDSSSMRIGK